jgi:hypothetical protein
MGSRNFCPGILPNFVLVTNFVLPFGIVGLVSGKQVNQTQDSFYTLLFFHHEPLGFSWIQALPERFSNCKLGAGKAWKIA